MSSEFTEWPLASQIVALILDGPILSGFDADRWALLQDRASGMTWRQMGDVAVLRGSKHSTVRSRWGSASKRLIATVIPKGTPAYVLRPHSRYHGTMRFQQPFGRMLMAGAGYLVIALNQPAEEIGDEGYIITRERILCELDGVRVDVRPGDPQLT